MGVLTEFSTQATEARQKESAGNLIISVGKLEVQFAETATTIVTLQAKIKSDVANDVWNAEDINSLMEALNLFQGIKRKGKARRKEILGMKTLLKDSTHKAELQTVMDNLNIPE